MLLKRWAVLTAFAASALIGTNTQAKESAPTGQVQCKDGTFSSAKGKGACSGHGGVLKESSAAEDAKAKASSAADDTKAKASRTVDDTKAKASRSTDDAKAKASGTADDAKAKASRSVDDAKTAVDNTVLCKDGTTSKAGQGACSHHGGVASAQPSQSGLPPPPSARTGQTGTGGSPIEPGPPPGIPSGTPAAPSTKSAPSPTQGTPTAKCKDGTFSYAKQHEGACSHHGGVAQWLDAK